MIMQNTQNTNYPINNHQPWNKGNEPPRVYRRLQR